MDRTLVIYDVTGKIISIVYGATEAPQGVPYLWCDIPIGAVADHVDTTTGQVVFSQLPDSDLGRMQTEINEIQILATSAANDASDAVSTATLAAENASSANQIAGANSTDIEDIQIALAEIYEMIIGGEA